MNKKTSTERVKKHDKAMKDAGKRQLRLYLKPENIPKVKGYAKELEKGE